MATYPYSMLRGRVIRVTELDDCGGLVENARWVVSKSVASVAIEERTYAHNGGASATILTDEVRVVEPEWEETIGYTVNLSLMQADPDIINVVSGNPRISDGNGNIIGFGADALLTPRTFALEVWTKLVGSQCAGKWGYTLFPRLWGGRLTGHTVENGLVNIELIGAQCRRGAKWTTDTTGIGFGLGPFGLDPFGLDYPDTPVGLVTPHNRFWTNTLVDNHPLPARYEAA